MTRTYDHNGETREISHPEMSDEDVAAQVASFGWDIDHVARDRILCLVKEKAELGEYVRQLEDDAQRVLVASNETLATVKTVTEDALAKLTTLSEQRAELLGICQKLIDYRRRAGPMGFQLEKCDDFIHMMKVAIDTQPSPATGAESESGT